MKHFLTAKNATAFFLSAALVCLVGSAACRQLFKRAPTNPAQKIVLHELVVKPSVTIPSGPWTRYAAPLEETARASMGKEYIDSTGENIPVPKQQSSNSITLGSSYKQPNGSKTSVVIGNASTENYFTGTTHDDIFVTGLNLPTLNGFDQDNRISEMQVNGFETAGHDTVVLPHKAQDYRVLPPAPHQVVKTKTPLDFNQRIVLEKINPDDGQEGLKTIVLTGIEHVVFTGDIDAPTEIDKIAEGNNYNYRDAVDQFLKNTKLETISTKDLHNRMMNGLTQEQRGAYATASGDLAEEYDNTNKLVARLVSYQSKGETEQYDKLFGYMTGKGGDPKEILTGSVHEVKAFFDPEKLQAVVDNNTGPFAKPEALSDLVMGANINNWESIKLKPAASGKVCTRPEQTAGATLSVSQKNL